VVRSPTKGLGWCARAAVETAQRQAKATKLQSDFARISANHGDTQGAKKVARVALARKILTLVYYGLRDGQLRSKATRGGVSGIAHHWARNRYLSWPPVPRAWPRTSLILPGWWPQHSMSQTTQE